MLNETGLESLSESLFAGHNITNIVISANHKLKTFHNRTFADAYNLQNLTITRNLHLEWPGPGSGLFQAFAGAQKLQVLDLEANNITLKGEKRQKYKDFNHSYRQQCNQSIFFVRPKDPYRIPESFSYRGHFARACDFEVRKRNDMQKYIQYSLSTNSV